MAEDGKLYIVITKNPNAVGSGAGTPNQQQTGMGQNNKKALDSYIEHQFFSFIKSQAITMVNYAISNIGNFTGDYYAQRDTQYLKEMSTKITSIALAGYAGFKLTGGNPIGAGIGVAISVAGNAINTALAYESKQIGRWKDNQEVERLREISGLNVLSNGSR